MLLIKTWKENIAPSFCVHTLVAVRGKFLVCTFGVALRVFVVVILVRFCAFSV